MSKYIATINVPGYSPMDDDPPTFDTAREAWDYLCDERTRTEDDYEGEAYSECRETLANISAAHQWVDGTPDDFGLAPTGEGTVYGDTPGYDGDHDLGLAYCVTEASD